MDKKKLALLIGGFLALPVAAGASTLEEMDVVSGHMVFANMSGFDEDIAAIAGLAESRVVWFNGQTIMSTLGEGYIYAVQSGTSCSPLTGQNFTYQGYSLSFMDPNDVPHIVGHYTYRCPSGLLPLQVPLLPQATSEHHVWVTATHARVQDPPVTPGDAGRLYNFALAVDTSFMDREEMGHAHDGGRTTSELNRGDSYCPNEDAHLCDSGPYDGDHTHNVAQVDLFFAADDRGVGAATADAGVSHPGTVAGCSGDPHCAAVTDPNATWQNPSG